MSGKSLTPSAKTPAAAPFGSLQAIDPKQLEKTIEQMYFQGKNVTPEQKTIFRHAVNRTGLDPIVGQIRPVLRLNRRDNTYGMAIQTSIDGYRLIADRTGVYAGSDEPVYGEQIDKPFVRPSIASVTVWKFVQGQRCPFTASARWTEYYPGDGNDGFMWRKMPFLMLAKCAEALALRKAFPADLSGIYTDDEMQQAGKEPEVVMVDAEQGLPVGGAATAPSAPPAPPAKPEPPTLTKVLESLTDCKDAAKLEAIYKRALSFEWGDDDRAGITLCYQNMQKRFKPAEAAMADDERAGLQAA